MTVARDNLRSYRPELDAVRFCAFFLVYLHHVVPLHPVKVVDSRLSAILQPGVWHLICTFALACVNGLPLFFMLSAYLITSLLLEEKEHFAIVNIRNFYVRRILRIWPLYFLGILLGVVYSLYQHDFEMLKQFPWFVFLAGNIFFLFNPWNGNPFTPLWSISIEEQFYLFWPWMVRWFTRSRLVWIALLLIVMANVNLVYIASLHTLVGRSAWCNSFVAFQMFAVGILLALFVGKSRQRTCVGIALLLLGPICWFIASYTPDVRSYEPVNQGPGALIAGYALIAIGAACVLRGFLFIGPALLPKWLPALGKISYGLYIYHLLAVYMVRAVFLHLLKSENLILQPILAFPLLLLMATLSYKYFEMPFLKIKSRFELVHSKPA